MSFPGSASAGQASRKGPNAGCDAAHHLSSSVLSASPSRPSCPLPVNVFFFFNPEICIQNICLPLGKPHIPNQPSAKCPNYSLPLRRGQLRCRDVSLQGAVSDPARMPLPSRGCIQTDSVTASEVWEPNHCYVHPLRTWALPENTGRTHAVQVADAAFSSHGGDAVSSEVPSLCHDGV